MDPNLPAGTPFFSPLRAFLRRAVFFGGVVFANLLATAWLADLFWTLGFHRGHLFLLAIFAILNLLLVLGSFHAFAGAWEMAFGRRRSARITSLVDGAAGALAKRYAVVMPVYNEDSARFCARIEAIHRSLEGTGHLDSFDFFLLSDTRDPDLWILEEVAWTNLCRRLDGFGRIYYRRRKINSNRKAGNIGDFVRTWGGSYEAMVVLDADSLMDGADIVKMTRTMEASPRLGILQTPPRLIRGTSVFTRLQQFAMRIYGPLFIRGLNFWQLGGGSYWGHNALIRLKPFSEFCELPDLPGREPFGGKILSHDFVEAALMVKEGWEVWLAWDIPGTYEEAPPTLIDHLKRDRRWCQGNLQHLWLIFARKLPATVRTHLFMGIMAYLGSPLWFLFLAAGTWIAWDREVSGLSALPFDGLTSHWLGINAMEQSLILAGCVFVMLFLPKLLGVAGVLLSSNRRREFGGGGAVLVGAALETLMSILLAPCVMLSHTFMVAGIVAGRSVGWNTQNRETDGTAWGDASRFHAMHTLIGIAWAFVAWRVGPVFLAWMSPILLGLVLSIPISTLSSRARLGHALARRRVLATPEEIDPPEVIRLADESLSAADPALDASETNRYGVIAAIIDPYVNGVHVSLLHNSGQEEEPLELAETCLTEGPAYLDRGQIITLLFHPASMLHMHRSVWLREVGSIHPVWAKALESYRRKL